MAIQFQCPICGSQFNAPDDFAGREARCGGCQNVVTVPVRAEAMPVAPQPTPSRQPPLVAPSSDGLPVVWVAGIAAAFGGLLVAIVLGGWLLWGWGGDRPPVAGPQQPVMVPVQPLPNDPDWKLQPDPPEDPSLAVSKANPEVALPERLSFSRHSSQYAVAERPAKGDPNATQLRVINLETGQPFGNGVVCTQPLDRRAKLRDLSASGAFFVSAAREQKQPTILVFAPLEGRLVTTITLGAVEDDKFGLALAGPRRLVTAHLDPAGVVVLQLQDVVRPDVAPTTIRYQPERNEGTDFGTLAVSPGGRYAALLSQFGERLRIWDLYQSQLVAIREYPRMNLWPGLAFSHDGKRLARLSLNERGYSVSVIDMATGVAMPSQTFPAMLQGNQIAYRGPRLEWSTSGKYLLFAGQDLIDAQSGKPVDTIRHDHTFSSHAWCRIAENDVLVHEVRQQGDQKYAATPLASRLASAPSPEPPTATIASVPPLPNQPTEPKIASVPEPASAVVTIKPDPTPTAPKPPATETSAPKPADTAASDPEAALAAAVRSEREARWDIPLDPPAALPTIKSGKFEIKLPIGSHGLLFPPGPSRFCVLQDTNGGIWYYTCLDLSTGKPIGKKVQGEIRGVEPRVSSDGRYLADRWGEHSQVGVWSFATGEQVCHLNDRKFGYDNYTFAGPHRLVTFHGEDQRTFLTIWDVRTGEQHGQMIVHDEHCSHDDLCVAPSPGGKLLAVMCEDTVKIVDLAAGKILGERSLSYLGKRDYMQLFGRLIDLSSIETGGLAFSPTGDRLAAVLRSGTTGFVVCLDARTGGVVFERLMQSNEERGYARHDEDHENRVDWTPDALAIQVSGSLLIDAHSGKDLFTLPWKYDFDQPRRVIRPWDMLTIGEDAKGDDYLFTLPLPKDAITKALAQVQGEGEAIDAVLPPRTDTRRDAVVKLPPAPAGQAWSVPVDGVLPLGDLRDRIEIADGHEKVRQVRFAGPASGKLAVIKVEEVNSERTAWLQQFDARGKAKSDRLKIHDGYRLADVSASGHAALLVCPDGQNRYERLDLVGFNPKKHLAGWRPYSDEDATNDSRQGRRLKALAWAAMIGDDHAVTINQAGRLIVWKVPDCIAVHETSGLTPETPAALSPGHRSLAVVRAGGIELIEPLTGRPQGRLTLPPGDSRLRCMFRDDGEELLVWSLEKDRGQALRRYEVATGKLLATQSADVTAHPRSHPIPYAPFAWWRHVLCRSDGTVLLDTCTLWDVERNVLAWRYVLASSHLAAENSPDGRLWFASNYYAPQNKSIELIAASLNGPEVRAKTADIRPTDQYALGPGGSVRLLVDLDRAGLGPVSSRIEAACRKALAARSVTVSPDARSQLSVVAVAFDSGKKLPIPKRAVIVAVGAEEIKESFWWVPDIEFRARLAVTDESGQACYRRDALSRPYDWSAPIDKDPVELKIKGARDFIGEQFLSDKNIDNMLPLCVFRHTQDILPGETFLSSDPVAKMPDNQKIEPLPLRDDNGIWPQPAKVAPRP